MTIQLILLALFVRIQLFAESTVEAGKGRKKDVLNGYHLRTSAYNVSDRNFLLGQFVNEFAHVIDCREAISLQVGRHVAHYAIAVSEIAW